MKNKERDGEIFMFGVLVKKAYKRGTDADRSTIKRWAAEHLSSATGNSPPPAWRG